MNIIGRVGRFERNRIEGWIVDKDSENNEILEVVLKYRGFIIATTKAHNFRADLKEKGLHPTGYCGFVFENLGEKLDINLFDLKVEHLLTSTVIEPNENVKSFTNNLLIKQHIEKLETTVQQRVCYLHVGMHKTGSSSIQKALYKHKYQNDTKYLNIGFENHSIPFYSAFSGKAQGYHINRRENRGFYDCLAFNYNNLINIKTQLNKTTHNIIISGEDISVLPGKGLQQLHDFIKPYFSSIKIVIYIREPHSYISSDFQELIKNGLSGIDFKKITSGQLYPNYRKTIERFDLVFGYSNVEVRLFDKEQLVGGDVVLDFIDTIGLEEDIEFESSNKSLSLEEASILYVFNKYYINNRDLNSQVNDKLLKLRQLIAPLAINKFILSRSFTNTLLNQHKEDINWLSKRMNIDIKTLLKDVSNPEVDVVEDPQQMEEIAWQQIRLLSKQLEGDVWQEQGVELLDILIQKYL